jgi:hypothetical protein
VPPAARIYCLVARNARKAVVFRRGPNRQVRLLSWDLKSDRVDGGQWLKGRIYERRCDLSPDGSLLVYFAAKFRGPVYSWTAISSPPFLSALAFFPKDDCWGGGGLFDDGGGLCLNHQIEQPEKLLGQPLVVEKSKRVRRVPRYMRKGSARPWEHSEPGGTSASERDPGRGWNTLKLRVRGLGERPGSGEDNPILSMRLERDGWVFIKAETHTQEHGEKSGSRLWLTFDPPVRRLKAISGGDLKLQVSWHGLKERDNRWYVESMEILGPGGTERSFGRVDWVDLDHNGDVLFSAEGMLKRARVWQGSVGIEAEVRVIADLNDMKFEEIPRRQSI